MENDNIFSEIIKDQIKRVEEITAEKISLFQKQINKQIKLSEDFPIYFTSLHPNLIYTTYNALSDTFSNFSEDTSKLKEIVKKTVENTSKSICFVSNREGNLIIQVSSPDFDTTTLYYLYEKFYQFMKTPEQPV